MMKDGRLAHVCRTPRILLIGVAASLCMVGAAPAQTVAAEPTQSEPTTGKPNIVIIWGDDIGQSNVSAYSHGLMGYQTPNIDRIASEGMMFTDYYAEQSCTAGRSSFITGQSRPAHRPDQGRPAGRRRSGLRKEDPTIAELLKPQGYATGQFGKNHLGDRNEFLPTVHGFDEFYGNLYHLNAEEEPEHAGLSEGPGVPRQVRSARRARLQGRRTRTIRPSIRASARSASRSCKDTGPLTKKRMETIDDDIANGAVDFIQRAEQGGQAVLRLGELHPHAFPHPYQAGEHRPGGHWQSPYHDTHDRPRQERRPGPQGARRSRHRRQHLRHVLDRQRPAHELVAGRRHDAVPQREEHELGRRLPRAGHGALAGQDQAGPGLQRDGRPPRLAADAPGDRRRHRREGQAAQGLQGRRHDLQGPSRRRQPRALSDGAGAEEPARVVPLLSTTTSS